ncbi:hypothetical protein GCM10017786_44340 [Amycolatopsis deserti]|uniref:DUF2293 domain-containing protein n=1 Tax=Amycolatopsis deserti TaxID=185696 RepID=A0ABQ3J8M7_9PSEU|nr:DUF2293 domain-containing protein [Amycolatopsis deserti]GHF05927.1 hypothetical protein GCM10017786_44340 [Amycolatopsis deserti]
MAGKLHNRVASVADAALAQRKYVAPVDVFTALGWVHPARVEEWRRGRFSPLAKELPVDNARIAEALRCLDTWARANGLTRSDSAYVAGTRDRRDLRFTDDDGLDRLCRTHWLAPGLTEKQRERLTERQNKAPDLAVTIAGNSWTCARCAGRGEAGDLHLPEGEGHLCLACADFDHLVFLPAGNAALSRRAKQESTLAVLVLRFNRRRKRHERQGILVEEAALERAEQQCLADEDVRARRRERDAHRRAAQDVEFQGDFADAIRRLYPGCPSDRARAIAEHAGTRGSGRVGRSAAGRALDEEAVRLAVIASVRHLDTGYDRMLMDGVPRADAREHIRPDLDRVLERWAQG